jgi:hypothetical protein
VGVVAIGVAAPLAAVLAVVVVWAATGQRLGHRAAGALMWQAAPGAGVVGWPHLGDLLAVP